MKMLITGGAGYVGSTVASACLDAGITPVILDDLSTGREEFVLGRLFYHGDIADASLLARIFSDHPDISLTIHCAAKVSVPESVARPLFYYRENVTKTLRLVQHLIEHDCTRILYSSSASVYRPTQDFAVDETAELEPRSPYARSKAMGEWILQDAARAHGVRAISLRYFNPIGADPRMRTGLQDPTPTHALGKLIEAVNQAQAHVRAIERFDRVVPGGKASYRTINVGTGQGTTVRELVAAFERATDSPVAVTESRPRPGDGPGAYACADLASELLGWRAERSLIEAIRDSVSWCEMRETVLRASAD